LTNPENASSRKLSEFGAALTAKLQARRAWTRER